LPSSFKSKARQSCDKLSPKLSLSIPDCNLSSTRISSRNVRSLIHGLLHDFDKSLRRSFISTSTLTNSLQTNLVGSANNDGFKAIPRLIQDPGHAHQGGFESI